MSELVLNESQLKAVRYLHDNNKYEDFINACIIATASSGESLRMAMRRYLTVYVEIKELIDESN